MKKISVIIPCYNVEQYIGKCIKSLVNQTIGIENLELIFVNDASTDRTLDRLKEWEKKYPESILIVDCKENGKQGKARNIGLTYATAEYIGFVDSDDIIELTMYEKLYYKMVEFNCDMVVCYAKRHTIEEKIGMGRTKKEDKLLLIDEKKREIFLNTDINRAVWNKLYKKNIIINNNIYFPEDRFYEDICFSAVLKHYVNRVYLLEEYLYHHIIWISSTSMRTSELCLQYFQANIDKILELRERGLYKEYFEYYDNEFFRDFFVFTEVLIKDYQINSSYLSHVNKIVTRLFPKYKDIPMIKNIEDNIIIGKEVPFYKLIIKYLDKKLTEEDIKCLKNVANQYIV